MNQFACCESVGSNNCKVKWQEARDAGAPYPCGPKGGGVGLWIFPGVHEHLVDSQPYLNLFSLKGTKL